MRWARRLVTCGGNGGAIGSGLVGRFTDAFHPIREKMHPEIAQNGPIRRAGQRRDYRDRIYTGNSHRTYYARAQRARRDIQGQGPILAENHAPRPPTVVVCNIQYVVVYIGL